jgi:hypothetical protein
MSFQRTRASEARQALCKSCGRLVHFLLSDRSSMFFFSDRVPDFADVDAMHALSRIASLDRR